MSNSLPLANKVAVITGAGRGIGKAIALAAAEYGADVALGSRTVSECEATAAECRALGRRAEAWRSGLSRAAIGENLAAVATVYRLGLRPRLGDAALGREIEAAFAAAHTALDALAMPLPAAVADPAARAQVEALRAAVSQLKALVSQRLAPALGLSLGFNSLDGD